MVSILSSNERTGVWTVPREITVYDFLGSVELDFTDAVFQHPDVTIKVLGSVEVKVKRTIKEKFVAFANSLKGTFQSR
ncbi:hypothetical protein [Idiomarina sp.]|uniref:hypothetical protein n=1 Tax=Idiomarina sp. TaxID=1874361 RepID=UPI00261080AB|nr:hypothetical protein [Idiomarina sp.]